MTHHVPPRQTSLAFAEYTFEQYLPRDSTGYVRPLTQTDARHEFYIPNGYGFFAADGNWLGSAESFPDIVEKVYKEGFTPFRVH